MRTPWLSIAFLALLAAGATSVPKAPLPPGLVRPAGGIVALVGASVIDGTGAGPRANCTIVIDGERIVAVGESVEVPEGAEVLDVTGKTVMPGLIDMHGHLNANVGNEMRMLLEPFARLYLAGGVTTVFSPGDLDPEAATAFRDAQRAGKETGTRIYTAGPYFTHGNDDRSMPGVANADEARTKLTAWSDRIDGVKVYTGITPDEFAAVAELAHELGLRVTGHLGSLTAKQAIELGIDRLEHGIYAMSEFGRPNPAKPFDIDYMAGLADIDFESGTGAALIEQIVAHHIVIDPTIVILEALFDGPLVLVDDWERYLTPQAALILAQRARVFDGLRNAAGTDREEWDLVVAAVLDKQRELARRVHEAGGRVVGGTDPVFIEVLPGYGMHRELEHFVLAGLTELEAIRACTLHAAEALELQDDLGSIEPGKLADLIVVDGDPSSDIQAVGNTRIVFQAGARLSPDELRDSVAGTIE